MSSFNRISSIAQGAELEREQEWTDNVEDAEGIGGSGELVADEFGWYQKEDLWINALTGFKQERSPYEQ
ncbi:hypothetical protein HPULCUR_010184 [Helicostylum pulchrum]|uniref:Uncharacterized protein n=1 Tax=Helicostylum pulchrum TaxID=562976 RepID=A0ABP9YCM9_9FUNG